MNHSNQLRGGAGILLVLGLNACERVGFTLVHTDGGASDDAGDAAATETSDTSPRDSMSQPSTDDGVPDGSVLEGGGTEGATRSQSSTRPDAADVVPSVTSADASAAFEAPESESQGVSEDDSGKMPDRGPKGGADDFDSDGILNLVDDDDDDDGFTDFEETVALTDPLDPRSPGVPNHYPGSILSDPCVQLAIAEYDVYRAAHGLSPFVINLEHQPSNVAGYYRGHQGDGGTEISSKGEYGRFSFGVEFGYKALPGADDRFQTWGVGYENQQVVFSWFNELGIVRGNGDSFTGFGNEETLVVIATTERRGETGSMVDSYELWVSVEPSGVYPQGVCTLGDWTANHWAVQTRLAGAEINYMCSDGTDGYITGMQWQSGADTCTCTDGWQESCSATPQAAGVEAGVVTSDGSETEAGADAGSRDQ